MDAHEVTALREEITAVLAVYKPQDHGGSPESPGGVVHGYGLAASQLQRLRDHNIPLTVTVDKVAASGGYMMAAWQIKLSLHRLLLLAPLAWWRNCLTLIAS